MAAIGIYKRIDGVLLEQVVVNPDSIESLAYAEDENDGCSLEVDRAWHGIHYLLTGHYKTGEPPLSYVVLGGMPLTQKHVVYGPQYITPRQVREAVEALGELSREELRKRFHPGLFEAAGIYPKIWSEEEALDYLLVYLDSIIEFFRLTAENSQAIVFTLV